MQMWSTYLAEGPRLHRPTGQTADALWTGVDVLKPRACVHATLGIASHYNSLIVMGWRAS